MSENAVVVRARVKPELVAELFPGWRVIRWKEALTGHRFRRIVVLSHAQTEDEYIWVVEQLRCRLVPGAELEWCI